MKKVSNKQLKNGNTGIVADPSAELCGTRLKEQHQEEFKRWKNYRKRCGSGRAKGRPQKSWNFYYQIYRKTTTNRLSPKELDKYLNSITAWEWERNTLSFNLIWLKKNLKYLDNTFLYRDKTLRQKVLERMQEALNNKDIVLVKKGIRLSLPKELQTIDALTALNKAYEIGLLDHNFKPQPFYLINKELYQTTKTLKAYIAEELSSIIWNKNKWRCWELYWNVKNLRKPDTTRLKSDIQSYINTLTSQFVK